MVEQLFFGTTDEIVFFHQRSYIFTTLIRINLHQKATKGMQEVCYEQQSRALSRDIL